MGDSSADIHWNDILLVSRHKGEVLVWKAWRRAIATFVDPSLWESTEQWGRYFERQPEGTGYGLDGYGMVVMDLDHKRGWSINDYSNPGSIYLPQNYELGVDHPDESKSREAFLRLLERPDQWPFVKIRLAPEQGFRGAVSMLSGKPFSLPEVIEVSLDQVADSSISPEKNQENLSLKRGVLKTRRGSFLVLGVDYNPASWVISTTLGRSELAVLEECLVELRSSGFPPPDSSLVLPQAEEWALDELEENGELESPVPDRIAQVLQSWKVPSHTPPHAPPGLR